jgi:hypothetical protein
VLDLIGINHRCLGVSCMHIFLHERNPSGVVPSYGTTRPRTKYHPAEPKASLIALRLISSLHFNGSPEREENNNTHLICMGSLHTLQYQIIIDGLRLGETPLSGSHT